MNLKSVVLLPFVVMVAGAVCVCDVGWAEEKPVPPPNGSERILLADSQLERLWNGGEFTEGVAVAPDGRIYFSNIPRDESPGQIWRYDPQTGKTALFSSDSGKSNGLMFNAEGELIACCGANGGEMAVCLVDEQGTVTPLVSHFHGKRFNSPNDLVIHPNGSIYFSDPRYVGDEALELTHMSVFRFDPGTKETLRVTTEITKPNGVMLSPDGNTLYVAETNNGSTNGDAPDAKKSEPRMTLNAFPIRRNGTLGERRILVDFGDELGIDGMTVDVAGNIYAAVRSPQRFGIIVYEPTGKELAYIPTPDLPTNCCFGRGKNATTLYVTIGRGLYQIPLRMRGHHLTAMR